MTVIGIIRVIARRWVWRVIFPMLKTIFFFLLVFFFALKYDDDISDESDDEGSGFGFSSGLCVSSCFEPSVYCVSWLLSSQFTIFIGSVRWIFSGIEVCFLMVYVPATQWSLVHDIIFLYHVLGFIALREHTPSKNRLHSLRIFNGRYQWI